MAQRTTFAKLQRERAKKAKAEAKRQRRQGKLKPEDEATEETEEAAAPDVAVAGEGEPSPQELLKLVETLHRQRERGEISLEEFEDRKTELFERLQVD